MLKITGQNKINGKFIIWSKMIGDHVPAITENFEGHDFVFLKRNYFLDTKRNKIRYQTMTCEGASYDNLYMAYINVNGIYAYCGTCTDGSRKHTQKITVDRFNKLSKKTKDKFISGIIPY